MAAAKTSDWNDLHLAEGLEVVLDQLLNPSKYQSGIQPMILELNKTGGLKRPTEHQVVEHLLKIYGDKIVKCGEDLFKYNGTHWQEFEERDYDQLKQDISVAGHKLPAKEVSNCYRVFMFTVKHVPRGTNLHQPNPYLANFQNGTLHLLPKGELKFLPHDPSDWCTTVLPYDCPALSSPMQPTPIFDAWTRRLWPDAARHQGNVELVLELMGSCLAPCYPNITFFIGASNSGKSTLVKLMVKMVSLENTSQVQLCDLKGFALESMLGKLVNFDTELELHRPINDVIVKKIVDRSPFNVDRKFKRVVSGYLPAVHFFAANDLPPTLDGSSKAYGRRIMAIKTDAPLAEGTETLSFETMVWEKEGQSLLIRVLDALKNLHQRNGRFTKPVGSAELVEEMEKRSDLIEEFFSLVNENELQLGDGFLKIGAELRIRKHKLWEVFNEWQLGASIHPNDRMTSCVFFRRMVERKISVKVLHGVREYCGFGFEFHAGKGAGEQGAGERVSPF